MQGKVLAVSRLRINRLSKLSWLVMALAGLLLKASECASSDVHSSAVAPQVYECRSNGQRVFSDQPCAADATKRELTVTNTMQARDAEMGYRALPAKSRQRKASPESPDSRDQQHRRCARLSNDKQTVNAKLRAGYKNNQGERLRDRLRKIDAEYYQLRCSLLR